MAFNFEKFKAVGGSFASKISVRTNGSLGLSQGALRKFNLETGDWWVVLFYDKVSQVVGIRPTQNEGEESAVRLQRREVSAPGGRKNLIAQVSARAFLDYFGIPYQERTRAFVPVWDTEHKMIIVDLTKEKVTVRRKKADATGSTEATKA